MKLLSGHSAFITGSTLGIGSEIAKAVSRAGAKVVLHGLTADEHARDTAQQCGVDGEAAPLVTGNLAASLPEGAVEAAEQALACNPDIDLLVCNAGTYNEPSFLEMDYSVFERTMQLNVASQFVMVQHFARRWVEAGTSGRIILTGSINGRLSEPTHVAYDTSKGAVEAMVRSLCVSLAPHGIRVNGIAPGLFRTPLTEPALQDDRCRRWMELHTPNGKVPGPDACAGTAVFLLSDAADHIHGQMLFVDGGMSIWQQPDPPDSWR
jgi:NAD(P)-dependent dehydrogenase (short-subunit alcohol dehydrogenase family)